MSRRWYLALHWQIIAALFVGLGYGMVAGLVGWEGFTSAWVAPFGVIFLNLLTMIAVPLVFATLVVGVGSLANLRSLSRIGGRSLGLFVLTSGIAALIALVLVAGIRPGDFVPTGVAVQLSESFDADDLTAVADDVAEGAAPLQLLVDMVPRNVFEAAADNRNLLQVILVALLVGVALLRLPEARARPVKDLMESVAEAVIALVDLVMKIAPLGVFALLADAITAAVAEDPSQMAGLFAALLAYGGTLALALAIQTFLVFALLVRFFTDIPLRTFYTAIAPAQLLAFSTSSSAATLPVTMRQCREELRLPDEVTGFVVPLGSTLNMNGTAMFLCVASVFLVQGMGVSLALDDYLTVMALAVMGSVGAVAIPSIGIVFLLVILQTLGLPTGGIALILSVDRVLDMMRTTTNVTGDGVVAAIVAAAEPKVPSSEEEHDEWPEVATTSPTMTGTTTSSSM